MKPMLDKFPYSYESGQVLRLRDVILITGEDLAARCVALPAQIPATNEQSPSIRVGEEDYLGMGGVRHEDALDDVPLVQVPHQTGIGVVGAGIEILTAIHQNDLVAAARGELARQDLFVERDVRSIRQDKRMIPWPFQRVRQLQNGHGNSP